MEEEGERRGVVRGGPGRIRVGGGVSWDWDLIALAWRRVWRRGGNEQGGRLERERRVGHRLVG